MRLTVTCSVALAAALALAGCSCSGEVGIDGDSGVDPIDGGESFDAEGVDAHTPPPGDGAVIEVDGGFLLPDGAVVSCLPARCAGRVYACGNCLDDDGDGEIDSADDGCIGPCDDTEDRYDLDISDTPTCMRDCYYDNDQGPGNDGCRYDSRCDPLAPDAPRCPYDPGAGSAVCPGSQPAMCDEVCGPLVPNGCDCFGCCELPAGSGSYVFLGGVDASGTRTCSPETIDDPTVCRPCTPYGPCLNACGHCELCLGRDELPADCFPPPPSDGGTEDAGTPPPRCEGGEQACGLPGDPACPAGYYCLTGCCIYFG